MIQPAADEASISPDQKEIGIFGQEPKYTDTTAT